MRVTFLIPGGLRAFASGRSQVEVQVYSPATVHDALEALSRLYPGVGGRVLTEQGTVREHVNLFVGPENTRFTGGLATPVAEGAQISIVPAISGG